MTELNCLIRTRKEVGKELLKLGFRDFELKLKNGNKYIGHLCNNPSGHRGNKEYIVDDIKINLSKFDLSDIIEIPIDDIVYIRHSDELTKKVSRHIRYVEKMEDITKENK